MRQVICTSIFRPQVWYAVWTASVISACLEWFQWSWSRASSTWCSMYLAVGGLVSKLKGDFSARDLEDRLRWEATCRKNGRVVPATATCASKFRLTITLRWANCVQTAGGGIKLQLNQAVIVTDMVCLGMPLHFSCEAYPGGCPPPLLSWGQSWDDWPGWEN